MRLPYILTFGSLLCVVLSSCGTPVAVTNEPIPTAVLAVTPAVPADAASAALPTVVAAAATSAAPPTSVPAAAATAASAPAAAPSLELATQAPPTRMPAPTDAPLPTLMPTAAPTATPSGPASLKASQDLGYVPILMYHYVRTVDENQDPLGFRLSVTPEHFEEQLAWIKEQGYSTVHMTQLAACLRGEQTCPEKQVALTFDDGYDDAYTAALPALQRHGFTATFYIVPNFVGSPGYMTWDQVRALQQAGMEIGSHTMDHADLTAVSADKARAQIVESRLVLERELKAPIMSFCYPAGKNSDDVAEMVRQAGYNNAVTTDPVGGLQRMFQLGRRRVLGGESVKGFPWYFSPVN